MPKEIERDPADYRPPAVILAGGQGRRMGGGDKPLRLLGGRPLLDRVLERLLPQAGRLALNANGDPTRFAGWGLPVLQDETADYPGPLAGVLAAMIWARQGRVLTVPGDTPFLPLDLAARLAVTDPARIAMARSPGGLQPTLALWPAHLAAALRAALDAGQRRIGVWAMEQGAVCVDFADDAAFLNINTPDDLAEAERRLTDR